jgi:hypothetical protein
VSVHLLRCPILLCVALFACNAEPDIRFFLARPANPAATEWQIYTRHAWRTVKLDGVRPPSYVGRHILDAGNCFFFSGELQESNTLRFRGWNILPPVRRLLYKNTPADTTGLPWLTGEDFPRLEDYQRFSLLAAAERWPWRGDRVEMPDSLAKLFRK